MSLQPNTRVWRYMGFANFVSLLQKKQLWLSCVELLDDKWEVMLDGQQLNTIINNRPSSVSVEVARDETEKMVTSFRKKTFVNCWSASEHESLALWKMYCSSPEGVAIQTTLDRLKKSVELPVLEVTYESYEVDGKSLDVTKLVTHKRPEFEYEHEVRIVLVQNLDDLEHPDRRTVGTMINWDPETHIENIWVHPDSQFWFIETVGDTVLRLAPKLSNDGIPRVWYSQMNSSPPF